MAFLGPLSCRLWGHDFTSDTTPDEQGVRRCSRCPVVRGAPRVPHDEERTALALEKLAAAARHDARADRVEGNARFKHRLLAEAEREVSRRIMRNVSK